MFTTTLSNQDYGFFSTLYDQNASRHSVVDADYSQINEKIVLGYITDTPEIDILLSVVTVKSDSDRCPKLSLINSTTGSTF
jgi:chromosome condensin MukBEF ATPase and DNA-binding subunit MukB